jgi:hypothetical protein
MAGISCETAFAFAFAFVFYASDIFFLVCGFSYASWKLFFQLIVVF